MAQSDIMSAGVRTYDSLHMGRSSIDLYSNDVGAPFEEITSFAAYVGGSPTNISVGGRRLGLKTALLTGLGEDPVGDFILHFLNQEGVETRFSPRKPGHRTSAVVLGIEPPDKFPLVYYRDNCADIELTIDDVLAAPVADSRVLQFAGTNLSKEPSRSATMFAAETGAPGRDRRGLRHRLPARPMARPARLWRRRPFRAAPGRHRHRHRGRDQRARC